MNQNDSTGTAPQEAQADPKYKPGAPGNYVVGKPPAPVPQTEGEEA